jgi:hypothetical protein
LVSLDAFGPRNVELPGTLGWVSTSIGVYDGPQGTACGRVSFDKTEAIGLALGSGIPALAIGATPANAYDRLEIDVEVKGDVDLSLAVTFEGRTTTYRLLAGSGVVPAGTADPENKVLRPGDQTYKCSAATDGGADSGSRDNCRWIIEDLGTSFKIIPHSGEFSLEGGGDFDNVIANRTFIYLTEADGILDCGDTISADSSRISCEVTRLTNPGCTAVPYVFRASESETSCTLTSDMGDQQLVANLFVDYGAEPARTTTNLGGLQEWLPAALSKVVFAQDLPEVSHDIPPCLDPAFVITETVLDPDGVVGDATDSGPQPFNATAVADYDRLPLVPRIQFACAFLRQEIYENPLGGALDVRIKEGIQFWGDITFVRSQE